MNTNKPPYHSNMLHKNRVVIRCDASHEIGFGHGVRCLALANELRDQFGCHVSFAMRKDESGFQMVNEQGYAVDVAQGETLTSYPWWLKKIIQKSKARALVLDVRDDLPSNLLKKLRSEGILLVTIDDPTERRLLADLAFYPPVSQLKQMKWDNFSGELFAGWEWVILRKEFARRCQKENKQRPSVLVTMGGSDPQAMTLKVLRSLDELHDDFDTVVVIGPGFRHRNELNKILAAAHRRFEVKENVADMAKLMAQSNLAIASFGVTAYELASQQVPAIYLCLTEDHVQSSEIFVEAGLAINMGPNKNVTEQELARTVGRYLQEEIGCLNMAAMVDGRGAERVASVITKRLEQAKNDH